MKYTLVKFVPDLVAAEYLNIGVILVTDAGKIYSEMLTNWERARSFCQNDRLVNENLKPIISILEKITSKGELAKIINQRTHNLYANLFFSEFQGDLSKNPTKAITYLKKIFLK